MYLPSGKLSTNSKSDDSAKEMKSLFDPGATIDKGIKQHFLSQQA
jgi:hypothetical protein